MLKRTALLTKYGFPKRKLYRDVVQKNKGENVGILLKQYQMQLQRPLPSVVIVSWVFAQKTNNVRTRICREENKVDKGGKYTALQIKDILFAINDCFAE